MIKRSLIIFLVAGIGWQWQMEWQLLLRIAESHQKCRKDQWAQSFGCFFLSFHIFSHFSLSLSLLRSNFSYIIYTLARAKAFIILASKANETKRKFQEKQQNVCSVECEVFFKKKKIITKRAKEKRNTWAKQLKWVQSLKVKQKKNHNIKQNKIK